MTLTTADGKEVSGVDQGPFEPIAIIGVSALMPDAPDVETFWQNILDAHVSIKEVAGDRWSPSIFWRQGGPGDIEEGYTYAKIGAFVEGFEFDWRRWRQPPGTLPQIDPCQLWAVETAAAALDDAGYGDDGKEFDRSRTGVVFANALGGENRQLSTLKIISPELRKKAIEAGLSEEQADSFKEAVIEGLPKVDEDTMPGELANVVAGRVANLLDLQGPNFATDAACASSMAALADACQMLQTRKVDAMLCGATDRTMDIGTFAKFAAIGALSPSHSTPFDARANGFVMGEGGGVLMLKRLSDALADGDEVKGVIRGVGASSDGRGKGITAPSQRGQMQAVARAYSQAEYGPETVELVEAHGTSTKVGDATEMSTLTRLWKDSPSGDRIAVGSIKSQIGHLKAAAGIAGIIKAVLGLHNATIPPSAGFETPNPNVDWDSNPFFVPTQAMDWPLPEGHPRRAGVSAFGFGGTNFHVALEGFDPEYHAEVATDWDKRWTSYSGAESSTPSMTHEELKAIEGGLLLLSGKDITTVKSALESLSFDSANFDDDPQGIRLSNELPKSSSFNTSDNLRLALIATSWAEFDKRRTLALKAMEDKEKWGFLQAQGILISDLPALPSQAKIAHMYPGQGSQYVGMTYDLFKRYTPVKEVWDQADVTMVDVLEGETLSSFVLRNGLDETARKEAEHKLKQTEYTQPAMLTADLAIERLLNAHGHMPDMVAGHSLGEYGALMSAGILDMDGALRAAAARGTEMGSVEIDDKGLMASITAPYDQIEEVLNSIEGYVIAANKNSPMMTVIAGETDPVKQAIAVFEEKGFTAVPLQTSHAFHSRIVAPANEPLRRFLESLEIKWPKIPITANVDGGWYPMDDGGDAKQAILSKLAPQMASSVEWTSQVEAMYDAGARVFVEVGPKRALTMFASQILGERALPVMTNHPKQGGIASFLTSLGALALAGRPPKWPEADSAILSPAFRAGPIGATSEKKSLADVEELRKRSRPLPSKGGESSTPQVVEKVVRVADSPSKDPERIKRDVVSEIIASHCNYPARFCFGNVDLRSELGLTDASINAIISEIARRCSTDSEYDVSGAKSAADLERWVVSAPASRTGSINITQDDRGADPYVITGISFGLPGGEKVFDDDNLEKLVRGETCIDEVTDDYKKRLLDRNIKRLIKGRDGQARMELAEAFDDIPQLAGLRRAFDLSEEFGIDPKIVRAWDITTQLATAAGLIAMRDAGIPLTPVEQVGKGGLRLIRSWEIPSVYRERTGVVFSSCFPGMSQMAEHAKNNGDDGEGSFDRRFLFQILNMGHSQFAQTVGIRGPNTTLNLACASATAAFTIAEDWLAADRCDRVVIISADDVTGDDLWDWIGAGFAASGAAATGNVVEDTALPFDQRRNGLILGMGAAAFVVERNSQAAERGVQPFAELLGASISNSAFHGTRLDVEHVAQTVDGFVSSMEKRWNINRHEIAAKTVFFSHETYTPARGGSAQAEVKALRDTFGNSADDLVISNTKGFTGHPMGVGIEDASMFYAMLTGRIPPIANHKVTDPELGDLNLSNGGDYPQLEYGMRFAAGFGSQIGLSLVRKWPVNGPRIDSQRLLEWNRNLAGTDALELRVLDNKLVAFVDGEANLHGGIQGELYQPMNNLATQMLVQETVDANIKPVIEQVPEVVEVPESTLVDKAEPSPAATIASTAAPIAPAGEVTETVIAVVVEHTGYPADFVELDQDLEGELGIDTVKQAEIMADIREKFSLPIDEDFILAEHPTLSHTIAYINKMTGGSTVVDNISETQHVVETPTAEPVTETKVEPVTESAHASVQPVAQVADSNIESELIAVVVKHTGYPEDFIEMDQDLEGELGIDTVKQAEIMADVRDIFSLPVDEDFILSDHPTLNHFVAYIVKMTGGETVGDNNIADDAAVGDNISQVSDNNMVVDDGAGVRRWQVEIEPCTGMPSPLQVEGTVILTMDNWGVAEAIASQLEQGGTEVARVSLEPGTRNFTEESSGFGLVIRADPGDEEQMSEVCKRITGEIGGLIHVAPIDLAGDNWVYEGGTSKQLTLSSHGLFGLLKGLGPRISENGFVASISAMDGRHGNGGERFNSLAAGAAGIVKTYAHERPELRCRALDLHPELIVEAEESASIILDDVLSRAGEVEIGLDRDGRRWALVLFAEDIEHKRKKLASDDVWLVSGGGSGVTAAGIIGVATASKNSGAKFVLLGRTQLIEETANWAEDELESQKMALRERMIEEHGKVTMVEWNKEWQKYTRSRDIQSTISAIMATGNHAEYHSCDVTDSKALCKIAKGLKVPITGLIHGAGLEDSKYIADKDWSFFELVTRVKIDGWRAMVDALEASGADSPRVACTFTSVAGRFGNGGQADYAAANNILDAEMARLTASGKGRGVAIAWTGWRDVGMATRGSLEKIFEEAGIETIPVELGVGIMVDELLAGGKRRVVACGSMGIMDRYDSFREAPIRLPGEMTAQIADPRRFPFIDKVLEWDDSSMLTQCTLSVADHPFLKDHAIDGIPYHPGVMAMEMFAQNALLLNSGYCLAGFENVKFGLPVKIMKGAMNVRVETKTSKGKKGRRNVQCRLVSDLVNSKGEVFGEPRLHHEATVRLVECSDDLCPFLQDEVDSIPDVGFPADGVLAELPSFIYLRYFHGPRFQSHGGVLQGVGDSEIPGVDGIALMRHQLPASDQFAIESEGEEVLLEALPMLIEAGFQNAGLVAMESEGMSSLPVGIEWSTMLRVPERAERLRLRSLRTKVEDAGVTVHDVLIIGEDDAPVLALKGLRLKAMAPVPENLRFELER